LKLFDVLIYVNTILFIGLLCCLGQANENFSPRVLVLLKESDNLFDNSVDNNFNSVISPSDYYYNPSRHVQLWNKVFDNLRKRINVLGHFFRDVDKIPVNSSPYIDRRFKKSISMRKPRHVNDNNTSVTTMPTTLNTISLNKSEISTNTNLTSTKMNIIDFQISTISTNNSYFNNNSTTSNPISVETTPLLVQQNVQNTSTNVNIDSVKPSSDISSSPRKLLVISIILYYYLFDFYFQKVVLIVLES
jgi:hypothetical protein